MSTRPQTYLDPDGDIRAGRLKHAVDAYAEMISRNPTNHIDWYHQGCLLASLNDPDRYRSHCEAMLQRFGDTPARDIADRTAKCSLLLPGVVKMDLATALADRAFDNDSPHPYRAWFQLTHSIAEYRAGRYAPAQEWASKARAALARNRTGAPTADLIIAMGMFRQGATAEAESILDRAGESIAQLGRMGANGIDDGFDNHLICQILLREAEGLIHPHNRHASFGTTQTSRN
jgi:tetratricopeptide (TPR) repeat protein